MQFKARDRGPDRAAGPGHADHARRAVPILERLAVDLEAETVDILVEIVRGDVEARLGSLPAGLEEHLTDAFGRLKLREQCSGAADRFSALSPTPGGLRG